MRRRRSSAIGLISSSGFGSTAASSASISAWRRIVASFSASTFARRRRSIARLRAVVVIQAPGLCRQPVARPALEGHDERLLDGFLGQVEVAGQPDQRRDRPSGLLAEQAIDDGPRDQVALATASAVASAENSQIGRTSTAPRWAPGIRDAASIASSRFAASIM